MTIDHPLLASFPSSATYPGCCTGHATEAGLGADMASRSPIDGSVVARWRAASSAQVDSQIRAALAAQYAWRDVPPPQRGELVRLIGEAVRAHKLELADLITLEAGKIPAEAQGEVQEWIDLCDFAVGLSRQLYGLTIASERPAHRMMEQWHPLGVVGVITAFNFPIAVWAWNAMIALVCGNSVCWKPSPQTPLCSFACHRIVTDCVKQFPLAPQDICNLLQGNTGTGEALSANADVALVSATGSIPMGQKVAVTVASRLGRYLLELGGNNAMILTPSADFELAIRAIVFAAVGTAGQRCTSLRRLLVHKSLQEKTIQALRTAYASLPVGDPRCPKILVGPLINEAAYLRMQEAIQQVSAEGGELLFGGERIIQDVPKGGYYVRPALARMPFYAPLLQEETFAPLLHMSTWSELDEAISMHNKVPQGLSSAIFTADVREAERFLSPAGSDCGIANVNIGTSGAEIGGAFGGEKHTGGGRESGSDAWKQYMRRVTCTINYGSELPLAQGIRFET